MNTNQSPYKYRPFCQDPACQWLGNPRSNEHYAMGDLIAHMRDAHGFQGGVRFSVEWQHAT